MRDVIATLYPDGATFLSGGLDAALTALPDRGERVERVLLMTDGQANRGVTSIPALEATARAARATISTIGLGAEYNEELLAGLADAGRGAYHYAEAGSDLAALYARELDRAGTLTLRDARVSLRAAPGWQIGRVYGWRSDGIDVSLGDLAAGETRTVVVRLDPLGADAPPSLAVEARALSAGGDRGDLATTEVHGAIAEAQGDPDPQVALAVARALAGEGVEDARQAWRRGDDGAARAAIAEARQKLERLAPTIPEAVESLGYVDHVAAAPTADVAIMRASEASRDLAR